MAKRYREKHRASAQAGRTNEIDAVGADLNAGQRRGNCNNELTVMEMIGIGGKRRKIGRNDKKRRGHGLTRHDILRCGMNGAATRQRPGLTGLH